MCAAIPALAPRMTPPFPAGPKFRLGGMAGLLKTQTDEWENQPGDTIRAKIAARRNSRLPRQF